MLSPGPTNITYIVIIVTLFIVVGISYYAFLMRAPYAENLWPQRWAGLYWTPIWYAWAFSFFIAAVSFFVFLVLFIANPDCADHHSMYHPICICSVLFVLSGAHYPYLLRRAELNGDPVMHGVQEQWFEFIFNCCTCSCFCAGFDKRGVIADLCFTASLSFIMLLLYCVSIDWHGERRSEACNENAGWVAGGLGWIVLNCVFIDLVFWGHTYSKGIVSDEDWFYRCVRRCLCVKEDQDPERGAKFGGPPAAANFQWPSLRLPDHSVETCAPLLPRGIASLDEPRHQQ
jgi:hypothetical protein